MGEGHALLSRVVIKEVTITLGTSTIAFLTGGLTDASFFHESVDGISELIKETTHFGVAEGANMYGQAQTLNVGAALDGVAILWDLRECCRKIKGRIKFTCTCPDGTGTGEASGKDIGGGVMVVRDHAAADVLGSEPTDTNDVHIIEFVNPWVRLTSGSVKGMGGVETGFVASDPYSESQKAAVLGSKDGKLWEA